MNRFGSSRTTEFLQRQDAGNRFSKPQGLDFAVGVPSVLDAGRTRFVKVDRDLWGTEDTSTQTTKRGFKGGA